MRMLGFTRLNPTYTRVWGVGFRSSNASCYNGGNPRNALAPQPTFVAIILQIGIRFPNTNDK